MDFDPIADIKSKVTDPSEEYNFDNHIVRVISICKYFPSPISDFCNIFDIEPQKDLTAFDLILASNSSYIKVILYPYKYDNLILSGLLSQGSLISILSATLRYDEFGSIDNSAIVLLNFTIVDNTSSIDFTNIYQQLGFDQIVPSVITINTLTKTSDNPRVFSLRKLIRYNSTIKAVKDIYISDRRKCRPIIDNDNTVINNNLIGRVISKSAIKHFNQNSPNNANFPTPFMYNIVIQDSTDSIKVTIWHRYVFTTYPHIEIGDIICLVNYRIKRDRFSNIEICVEFTKKIFPATIYKILDDSNFSQFLEKHKEIISSKDKDQKVNNYENLLLLSKWKPNYVSIYDCEFLLDKVKFDLIGVIIYISSIRRKIFNNNLIEFIELHVVDNTTNRYLSVFLILNSRTFSLASKSRVKPGDLIGLFQVELFSPYYLNETKKFDNESKNNIDSSSRRVFFAQSTEYTYFVDYQGLFLMRNINDDLKFLINWYLSLNKDNFSFFTQYTGYYNNYHFNCYENFYHNNFINLTRVSEIAEKGTDFVLKQIDYYYIVGVVADIIIHNAHDQKYSSILSQSQSHPPSQSQSQINSDDQKALTGDNQNAQDEMKTYEFEENDNNNLLYTLKMNYLSSLLLDYCPHDRIISSSGRIKTIGKNTQNLLLFTLLLYDINRAYKIELQIHFDVDLHSDRENLLFGNENIYNTFYYKLYQLNFISNNDKTPLLVRIFTLLLPHNIIFDEEKTKSYLERIRNNTNNENENIDIKEFFLSILLDNIYIFAITLERSSPNHLRLSCNKILLRPNNFNEIIRESNKKRGLEYEYFPNNGNNYLNESE